MNKIINQLEETNFSFSNEFADGVMQVVDSEQYHLSNGFVNTWQKAWWIAVAAALMMFLGSVYYTSGHLDIDSLLGIENIYLFEWNNSTLYTLENN